MLHIRTMLGSGWQTPHFCHRYISVYVYDMREGSGITLWGKGK